MPLGTTLAFMMAITAISLPEFIILQQVIKTPLIAVFATIVTIGILFDRLPVQRPHRIARGVRS